MQFFACPMQRFKGVTKKLKYFQYVFCQEKYFCKIYEMYTYKLSIKIP